MNFRLSLILNPLTIVIVGIGIWLNDPYTRTVLYALEIFMLVLCIPSLLGACVLPEKDKPSRRTRYTSTLTDVVLLAYFIHQQDILFSVFQMITWLCCELSFLLYGTFAKEEKPKEKS